MIVHISDRIYEKLNIQDKNTIKDKINKFAKELSENHSNITSVSKGFWARPIISHPGRYKFRVNNKDRIIFEYGKNKNEIYFLDYCNHDAQIRTAKQIKNTMITSLEVDYSEYKNEPVDNYIDEYYRDLAFEFLKDENYIEALEAFKQSNDKQGRKQVNFIINNDYAYIRKKFSDQQYRTCIKIEIGSLLLEEADLLYIFNRIYSEYKLILAPYYMLNYQATSITYFLSDAQYKKAYDYNKALAKQLIGDLKNSSDNFAIFGCLCDKDKNIVSTDSDIVINLREKTINKQKKVVISNTDVWNLAPIPDTFSDSESKITTAKKLTKQNLDFIFG